MAKLIAPVVEAGSMSGSLQPEVAVNADLKLRPWTDSDAPAVLDAFSTADIQHYHFRRFDEESDARSWIGECAEGWMSEKSATWAIVTRLDNKVLGRITIYTSLEDGHGEVSYWVLPSARGRGVATQACVTATRWAHTLGLHRIQLQHSTGNDASRHVALAAGFVEEGIMRGANLHADGWHDMSLYSHLATDSD